MSLKPPFRYGHHGGGLVQSPSSAIRLNGVSGSVGGGVYAVEVWHWHWRAPVSNWRNRHRHGWTILKKRRRLLYEQVLMVKYISPSTRSVKR